MDEMNQVFPQNRCSTPDCSLTPVVHLMVADRVRGGRQQFLCEDHALQHLAGILASSKLSDIPTANAPASGATLSFIEIVLYYRDAYVHTICLREVDGNRRCIMHCGPYEAAIISGAACGIAAERPLTHDAMANAITLLGGKMRSATIRALAAPVCATPWPCFTADVIIDAPRAELRVDMRPSDAMTLSLKLNAPLFVDNDILSVDAFPSVSPQVSCQAAFSPLRTTDSQAPGGDALFTAHYDYRRPGRVRRIFISLLLSTVASILGSVCTWNSIAAEASANRVLSATTLVATTFTLAATIVFGVSLLYGYRALQGRVDTLILDADGMHCAGSYWPWTEVKSVRLIRLHPKTDQAAVSICLRTRRPLRAHTVPFVCDEPLPADCMSLVFERLKARLEQFGCAVESVTQHLKTSHS